MDSLDDILDTMLEEVKVHRANKKAQQRKASKTILDIGKVVFAERTSPGLATLKFPWKDEALVQMMTVTTCKKCGNEGVGWEPYVFIERTRTVRGKLERHLERIDTSAYDDIYQRYPKRVEVRETHSISCPHCFKDLPTTTNNMIQSQFNYNKETN